MFLINEIQNGAVVKSYMTNGLLLYGEIYAHFLIYSIRKPFHIYDFAAAPLRISFFMRKILFSFLSVYSSSLFCRPGYCLTSWLYT